MPSHKTTGDWAKQRIDSAITGIQKAQYQCAVVAERYEGGGQEEIALALVAVLESVEPQVKILKDIRGML